MRSYEKPNKLAPDWQGPYSLTEQIGETMWKATPVHSRLAGPGRKPVDVFHQDQIQPIHELV